MGLIKLTSRNGVAVLTSVVAMLVLGLLPTVATASGSSSSYVAGPDGFDGGAASDSNDCSVESTPCSSLSEALAFVTNGGTIYVSGTLTEATAARVSDSVTIADNPDGSSAILEGHQDQNGLLTIGNNSVTVQGIEFEDGDSTVGGGAIDSSSGGSLTVIDSKFLDNTSASYGGAIGNDDDGGRYGYGDGTVTVEGSTFTGNSGYDGGAIDNDDDSDGDFDDDDGTVTVEGSTFTGNSGYDGGAIDNNDASDNGDDDDDGSVMITDSTFTGNNAAADGGAVDNNDGGSADGWATIEASTLAGNTAAADGGALDNNDGGSFDGSATIVDSTLTGNTASGDGGAIDEAYGTSPDRDPNGVVIVSSTLSGNTARGAGNTIYNADTGTIVDAADVFDGSCVNEAGWDSRGYVESTDRTCLGDQTGGAAVGDLGSLANNGGTTQTMELLAGNPAIDLIPAGISVSVTDDTGSAVTFGCPIGAGGVPDDQRGDASVTGAACDAGAVQYAAQSVSFASGLPSAAAQGQSGVVLSASSTSGLPVSYTVDAATTNNACTVSGAAVTFAQAGSCVIDANQAGNSNFAPASAVTHPITVGAAQTTVALTSSGGQLIATVTVEAPATGTPTGTVMFMLGGQIIGTATLVNGVATLSYTAPAGSTESITADYQGAVNDATSNATATVTGPAVTSPTTTSTPPPATSTPPPATSTPPPARSPTPTAHKKPVVRKPIVNPTITARLSSLKPRATSGWWTSPVTVTFACNAKGAAITGGCPSPVTLDRSGKGQTVNRTIKTATGGRGSVKVSGIDIDLTTPTVRITGPQDHTSYLLRAPAAGCVAMEGVSGVMSCKLTSHAASTPDGSVITYSATATSNAGTTNTSSLVVHLRSVVLVGAEQVRGGYRVTPGTSYTLEVLSNTEPTYLDATVAPGRPFVSHDYFVQDGEQDGVALWTLPVMIEYGFDRFRDWSFGVEIGGTVGIYRLQS